MMYCINSLLTLRLTLIVLVIIFFRKCFEEIIEEISVDLNEVLPPPTLNWKSIDLENPPLINNSLVERLRLNELLASVQYRCNKSTEVGDDVETFTVCEEAGSINTVFIVTGSAVSSGTFEKHLGATKWTVFLPEGNDLVERLDGDIEIHYLTELKEWDRWATWDMEYAIRGRTYDLAKMDLYSTHMRSFDQPSVVRQLVQYQLLYWLFFSQHYALIGATSTGICGQNVQNCKYRISMLRMDTVHPQSRLLAPVFGLGSPTEELNRLAHYIESSDCPAAFHQNFPSYCINNFSEDSNVLLISYQLSLDIPSSISELKNFNVVSPTISGGSLDLKIHNHAIGPPGRNETIDKLWRLRTLENTIYDLYKESIIDLLLIDTVGGEFTLLPELLRLANATRFTQLSIRGHIWSEENENFRDLYWNLRQLENHGYSRRHGRVSLPRYDVVYERK